MDNRLDLCSSDEYGDGVEENRKANSTKWLKSSNVSLANLQQVKPVSVYNLGITNQKDLKATNLSLQRSNSFNNLVAEPVLQSVSSKKTAWGSNGCIPDLLKPGQRPGSAKPGSRPGSAKPGSRPGSAKSSARKYHPPTGKKTRPQSAKEDGVKHTSPSIAIKGAKFDPTGRPPKSFAATTGWIGPPAGMKFAETRPGSARSSLSGKTPPPPMGTPTGTPTLHIDVDLQSSTTEDDNISPRLRYTHAEPQRTPTPPHVPPAPIHLMLPSMYDEEDEDEDELDTERLLQMADQHIHADKKSECINDFIEKVSSANHLPGYTYTHTNGQCSQESKLEVHSHGGSEVVSWEREEINNSADFSDYGSSGTNNSSPRSDVELNNHPHPLEKISVKFSEDRNVTIDITPRNAGHKVSELTRKKPLNKLEEDGELQSFMSVSSANACEIPVSSRNNNTVSLTEMKHDNKSVRTLPNRKSYTRPKNENLEFKFTSQENAQCDRNHGNKHVSVTSNRPTTPVSSITVAYCDLDDAKKQKRYRGLKKDRDVVTLVQQVQVSDSDDENQEEITPDKLESWMPTKTTSQPSKNYYELSRQAAKLNSNVMRKEKIDPQLIGGAPLVKTIKTIELAESGNDLKETKTQSFIDKQVSAFGEKDKQQREATRVRTRPRPGSEMLNRNAVKNEKEANSKTEPDQKVESSQKKRPFSAPPRRRPSSAIKEKKEKEKNKITEKSLTDITSTPINENPDVTYIIQADNTNDQEFVAMETEEDKMSDFNISQDSVTDEENYIEEPAMTDKDIEIEKIIERHLGKPSQTLSYPSQEEETSLKSNKKQSKLSSTQKKFTAHSHNQCNCPLRSKSDSKKVSTVTMQLPNDDKEDKISNKVYGEYARRKSAPPLCQITKSKPAERPRTGKPVYITSKNPHDNFETEENIECQKIQAKLAANGVNVKAETLERALYPPSGKTKYYEINARLPQHTSTNLLSHPKEWLPIEYRQLKLAEKALNRANEIMYKQRMAEDRKARLTELVKKKVKGKKKGKTKGKKTEETGGTKSK